jgi:hypothetical protein
MSYVYVYINPITNLPFYVGEGQVNRAKTHWSKILNGKVTHNRALTEELRTLLVAGKEPIIHMAQVKTKDEGLIAEEHLIRIYGRRGKEPNGILCNRCSVGSDNTGTGHFSRTRSTETRAKIAAGHLGKPKPKHTVEHNAKIATALSGKIFSETHRANLSASLIGLTHKYTPRSKFTLKNPAGETIIVHGSLDAFCQQYGLNRKSLYDTLKRNLPIRIGKNAGWQLHSSELV